MWVIHVITKSDESTFTSGHKSLCSLNEKLIILMEINPKCVCFFFLSLNFMTHEVVVRRTDWISSHPAGGTNENIFLVIVSP